MKDLPFAWHCAGLMAVKKSICLALRSLQSVVWCKKPTIKLAVRIEHNDYHERGCTGCGVQIVGSITQYGWVKAAKEASQIMEEANPYLMNRASRLGEVEQQREQQIHRANLGESPACLRELKVCLVVQYAWSVASEAGSRGTWGPSHRDFISHITKLYSVFRKYWKPLKHYHHPLPSTILWQDSIKNKPCQRKLIPVP